MQRVPSTPVTASPCQRNQGMIATGNHNNLNSLRGATPSPSRRGLFTVSAACTFIRGVATPVTSVTGSQRRGSFVALRSNSNALFTPLNSYLSPFSLTERLLGYEREEASLCHPGKGRGRAAHIEFSCFFNLPTCPVGKLAAFFQKKRKNFKNIFDAFLKGGKIPKTGLPTEKKGNEMHCSFDFHKIPPGGIGQRL